MTEWVDGVPAKWVTETEPEFDANERDNWYALAEYDDALCPQCHQLRSVCEDPTTVFHPQLHVCKAVSSQAIYERRWRKRHENTKPDQDGWLPTDGTFVWVTPDETMPRDDFLDTQPLFGGGLADQHDGEHDDTNN